MRLGALAVPPVKPAAPRCTLAQNPPAWSSTNEYINKTIYTYNETLFRYKKKISIHATAWIILENIMLSEIARH